MSRIESPETQSVEVSSHGMFMSVICGLICRRSLPRKREDAWRWSRHKCVSLCPANAASDCDLFFTQPSSLLVSQNCSAHDISSMEGVLCAFSHRLCSHRLPDRARLPAHRVCAAVALAAAGFLMGCRLAHGLRDLCEGLHFPPLA